MLPQHSGVFRKNCVLCLCLEAVFQTQLEERFHLFQKLRIRSSIDKKNLQPMEQAACTALENRFGDDSKTVSGVNGALQQVIGGDDTKRSLDV